MLWAARIALAGILLGSASTGVLAANAASHRTSTPVARPESQTGQWLVVDPRSG